MESKLYTWFHTHPLQAKSPPATRVRVPTSVRSSELTTRQIEQLLRPPVTYRLTMEDKYAALADALTRAARTGNRRSVTAIKRLLAVHQSVTLETMTDAKFRAMVRTL